MQNPRELAQFIATTLENKKAEDVIVLDVTHLTSIAEYFVIAGAHNTILTRALAEEVEDKLAERDVAVRRKEGYADSRWVVLDYGSVIVHVFHEHEREYYNIERLWMDGSNVVKF